MAWAQAVDSVIEKFLGIITDDRAEAEIVQVGRTQQILVRHAKISSTACEDDEIFVRKQRFAAIIIGNASANRREEAIQFLFKVEADGGQLIVDKAIIIITVLTTGDAAPAHRVEVRDRGPVHREQVRRDR